MIPDNWGVTYYVREGFGGDLDWVLLAGVAGVGECDTCFFGEEGFCSTSHPLLLFV